jgi:hypothetical protein
MRFVLLALLGLFWIGSAEAQTPAALFCYQGPTNPQWAPCTGSNPLASTTYQFASAGAGQYAVAITSAQTLTIPAGSLIAEICVETASARYTTTGTTPTSTVGVPVASGGCFQLAGAANLTAFKIIGSGATMDVEYFK